MEEGYWELFWATGAPVFYLLYRQGADFAREEAKTASAELPAADV